MRNATVCRSEVRFVVVFEAGRLMLCALLATVLEPGRLHAADEALAACREQRLSAPERALVQCREAEAEAHRTGRTDQAIEVMFHASEASQALGRFDAAQAQLDGIDAALPDRGALADRFRLQRRRGMLAFRRDRYAEALEAFERARPMADQLSDRERSIILNDLGVVQRRLADYPAALANFIASFELKTKLGHEEQLGPALQNIGNVYRESGDFSQAQVYFRRALALHRAHDEPLKVAHAHESLALAARDSGDLAAAAREFNAAWTIYNDAQATPDQFRVALRQAELAVLDDDRDSLFEWLQAAAQRRPSDQPEPLAYARLVAEADALAGRTRNAFDRLQQALAQAPAALPLDERHKALGRLAAWAEALNDFPRALALQREAFQAQHALDERHRSEALDRLRVRFDVAERERELAVLEAENARQAAAIARNRYRLHLLAGATVLLMAGLLALHRRRIWRLRVDDERRRAQFERELDHFRSAANQLRADRNRLRFALDRSTDAILLVDAAGRVYLANQAARHLLGRERADHERDQALTEWLGPELARQVTDWLARWGDGGSVPTEEALALSLAPNAPPHLWLMPLALEEELYVVGLSGEAGAGPSPTTQRALHDLLHRHVEHERPLDPSPGLQSPDEPGDAEADAAVGFRHHLVELMRATLDTWEASTRKTRLDLAERSGIWRITIDDGRLRVRTLERYLSAERLPEHPRWREVVRTAYFVLAECPLDDSQRARLKTLIEQVKSQAG